MHYSTMVALYAGLLQCVKEALERVPKETDLSQIKEKLKNLIPQVLCGVAGLGGGRDSPVKEVQAVQAAELVNILNMATGIALGNRDLAQNTAGKDGGGGDPSIPLVSIFGSLNNGKKGRWVVKPNADGDSISNIEAHFPEENRSCRLNPEDIYSSMLEEICRILQNEPIGEDEKTCYQWQAAMENHGSFVPAKTALSEGGMPLYNDISLYDYSRITAAAAVCLNEYLIEHLQQEQRSQMEREVLLNAPVFLLLSCDFSGIQDFIYNITSQKALGSLRGRSFTLEFFTEYLVDEIAEGCGVNRINMIYAGGGHSYLLLPNTERTRNHIEVLRKSVTRWLIDHFEADLYLSMVYVKCSPNDLMNHPVEKASYKTVFTDLEEKMSRNKMQRYTPKELNRLNNLSHSGTRECPMCKKARHIEDEEAGVCSWCNAFIELSKKLSSEKSSEGIIAYVFKDKPSSASYIKLPRSGGESPERQKENYVCFFSKPEVPLEYQSDGKEEIVRLYGINTDYISGKYRDAISISVNTYSYSNLLDDYVKVGADTDGKGIKRIGVLRADVDSLGSAFMSGFDIESDDLAVRYSKVNLCRTASLSRQITIFFKKHLKAVLEGKVESSLIDKNIQKAIRANKEKHVSVIYAGGDDLFLIGEWKDVLDAAVLAGELFFQYSCGSLTLSGGLGLFTNKYPISRSAEETAALLEEAKQAYGKNSICLFEKGGRHCYKWDRFKDEVLKDKLTCISGFLSKTDDDERERGMNFLHNLLELLEKRDAPINIARYAYTLARMQPSAKSSAEYKREYERFSKSMYDWIKSPEDTRKLITAIHIFVYMERRGEAHG